MVRYDADVYRDDWTIEDEEKVPQSRGHLLREERVAGLLKAWAAREHRNVQVGQELALRWDESHPRVGVDPDVYVVEPPPPEGDEVMSLRTWETGHNPPLLAIEIVSPSRPNKDYEASPDKYAAAGVYELWVFDPHMIGRARGGPFRLQVWRRDGEGNFDRVYKGEGPAYSKVVSAWIFATNEGRRLGIADDEAGTTWWMTPEEEERAAKEKERAAKEQALAEKDALARRVAELEAQLAGRKPAT